MAAGRGRDLRGVGGNLQAAAAGILVAERDLPAAAAGILAAEDNLVGEGVPAAVGILLVAAADIPDAAYVADAAGIPRADSDVE